MCVTHLQGDDVITNSGFTETLGSIWAEVHISHRVIVCQSWLLAELGFGFVSVCVCLCVCLDRNRTL